MNEYSEPVFNVVEFQYKWLTHDKEEQVANITLQIPIENCSVEEKVCVLMNEFGIPCYHEEDLLAKLSKFVKLETMKLYEEAAEKVLNSSLNYSKEWITAYSQETKAFGKVSTKNDEELFSEVYQGLVHSSALQNALLIEEDLINVYNQQLKEMEATYGKPEDNMDDNSYISRVSAIQHSCKSKFYNSIIEIQNQLEEGSLPASPCTPRARLLDSKSSSKGSCQDLPSAESFTVQLGTQMKQAHNLRLLISEISDLALELNFFDRSTRQLQTALSLYGNNLLGFVMTAPQGKISEKFLRYACEDVEFHFDNVLEQVKCLKLNLQDEALEWRKMNPNKLDEHKRNVEHFDSGDVMITHHSNIPGIHLVFHLVTDDSVMNNDIGSRHSVILGLRNILKVCCTCDITTLTVPLLLSDVMTEQMTIAWCLKRSELIFKCVKGFMMEMALWGGSTVKTLQFIVPKDISDEAFSNIGSLLPSVFRMSNPLIVKSS